VIDDKKIIFLTDLIETKVRKEKEPLIGDKD